MDRAFKWWEGLDHRARDWFVLSGLLLLGAAGIAVGVVGAVNVATLEPLMHIGLSVGISGLLGFVFSLIERLT